MIFFFSWLVNFCDGFYDIATYFKDNSNFGHEDTGVNHFAFWMVEV